MSKPTMTQAVMETWDASTNNFPKLYNEDLPEDAPQTPAAYFLHNGEQAGKERYNTASTKPAWLLGTFDIVLFVLGVTAVETLATLVMQVFTINSLALDNSQEATLFRTNYLVRGTAWRDERGEQVYMATISYECWIGNPTA